MVVLMIVVYKRNYWNNPRQKNYLNYQKKQSQHQASENNEHKILQKQFKIRIELSQIVKQST